MVEFIAWRDLRTGRSTSRPRHLHWHTWASDHSICGVAVERNGYERRTRRSHDDLPAIWGVELEKGRLPIPFPDVEIRGTGVVKRAGKMVINGEVGEADE